MSKEKGIKLNEITISEEHIKEFENVASRISFDLFKKRKQISKLNEEDIALKAALRNRGLI